jgi:hypothetical protein
MQSLDSIFLIIRGNANTAEPWVKLDIHWLDGHTLPIDSQEGVLA